MSGLHPEDNCDRCGREMRMYYSAVSEVWNKVMRDDSGNEQYPVACLDCFIELCREENVEPDFVHFRVDKGEFSVDLKPLIEVSA